MEQTITLEKVEFQVCDKCKRYTFPHKGEYLTATQEGNLCERCLDE